MHYARPDPVCLCKLDGTSEEFSPSTSIMGDYVDKLCESAGLARGELEAAMDSGGL